MSVSTNSLGKSGESHAITHLVGLGFKILERNWRFRRAEIDIIAENEQFIVFVEVKMRKDTVMGNPEQAVTRKKQKRIILAANEYLVSNNLEKEARFDLVSIVYGEGPLKIDHIPDAFYPTL